MSCYKKLIFADRLNKKKKNPEISGFLLSLFFKTSLSYRPDRFDKILHQI